MALHNQTGIDGEKLAADYLERSGYEIMERNSRFHNIEIDIIARNTEYIVFVEVKTRATDVWGYPEEAVDSRKISRMVEAADYYLEQTDIDLPVRFDVISVIKNGNTIEVKHFDDAFFAPLN